MERFYLRRRIEFKILQPLQKSEKEKVPWSREIVYGGSTDIITGQMPNFAFWSFLGVIFFFTQKQLLAF